MSSRLEEHEVHSSQNQTDQGLDIRSVTTQLITLNKFMNRFQLQFARLLHEDKNIQLNDQYANIIM